MHTYIFETKFLSPIIRENRIVGVCYEDKEGRKELSASAVFLGIGHSARDTFRALYEKNIPMEKKIIVNFSTPYFIDDYFPDDKTFLHIGYAINPQNSKAAAEAILGKFPITGKLKYKNIKL